MALGWVLWKASLTSHPDPLTAWMLAGWVMVPQTSFDCLLQRHIGGKPRVYYITEASQRGQVLTLEPPAWLWTPALPLVTLDLCQENY